MLQIFTLRGKTKVSYYIRLWQKQKYHITSRSSKLSWDRFLVAFVILIEESFILLREKESNLLCLQEEQYIPFNEQQVSCYKYLHCQGFWNFTRSWSREIQVYPRNPAKLTKTHEIPRNSLEILPNTCRYNIFETYLGYWSCLLAVNLQIYPEISSLPRVNNVPKLPWALATM